MFKNKIMDPNPDAKSLEDEVKEFIKDNPDKKVINIYPVATIPGLLGEPRGTTIIMAVLYEENNKVEK